MHPVKEAKGFEETMLRRRVRVAWLVGKLVMASVLRSPPERSALIGQAAEHAEQHARVRATVEGSVGGVSMETDGHADANACDGEGDCGSNSQCLQEG